MNSISTTIGTAVALGAKAYKDFYEPLTYCQLSPNIITIGAAVALCAVAYTGYRQLSPANQTRLETAAIYGSQIGLGIYNFYTKQSGFQESINITNIGIGATAAIRSLSDENQTRIIIGMPLGLVTYNMASGFLGPIASAAIGIGAAVLGIGVHAGARSLSPVPKKRIYTVWKICSAGLLIYRLLYRFNQYKIEKDIHDRGLVHLDALQTINNKKCEAQNKISIDCADIKEEINKICDRIQEVYYSMNTRSWI